MHVPIAPFPCFGWLPVMLCDAASLLTGWLWALSKPPGVCPNANLVKQSGPAKSSVVIGASLTVKREGST